MCGICGMIRIGGAAPGTPQHVRAMSRAIAHRGPDGEGYWDTPDGTLGHRRLAIIDVEGGAQPMFDEDDRLGIVFNGEIYNFRELRAELTAHGHEFRTRSDTEVLIHGYEQWGAALPERLRGMFAFALWDARRRTLFAARDRLGIKPFYYHADPATGAFTFASEIKALFANPVVSCGVNHARLPEYLLFRYVAGAETMFEGVRELEPGTCAVLTDAGLDVRRYWSPRLPDHADSAPDAQSRGRELLEDAVRSHLVSDVGIGTITSGGLDSSLVSAIAARSMDVPIDTFCMGFDDPRLDERPFAREVAAGIGARHHDTVMDAAAFGAQLDELTWLHDEPLSHPNAIAMHGVFALARHEAGIPVLLSGEGADEVFGGYGWYRAAWKRDRIRRLIGERGTALVLRSLLRGPARDVADPDYFLLANALGRGADVLAVDGVRAAVSARRERFGSLTAGVAGMFVYDQLTYLQPLLQRQDRMSMAVGLEARVPFLDHPLVEWGNALSARTKLRGGQPKGLLRDIAAPFLDHGIIHRQKVGFALPLAEWLRGPLRERLAAVTDTDSLSASLLTQAAVRAIVDRLDRGDDSTGTVLWTLLALEVWREQFAAVHDRIAVTV
jgi:asparagine synthase (glutamine-hydrolysing)